MLMAPVGHRSQAPAAVARSPGASDAS
jgi:hypothetical protein